MDQQYYELNIENWANSIIELEENNYHAQTNYREPDPPDNSALISMGAPTYYRTKAFSSQVGINNLINAADPLLTLISKLRRITIPPETSILYQNICHEIKAFENKAQTIGYRNQLIVAARYIICCVLDELLAITLWSGQAKLSFVDTFHKDMVSEDRFFLILDRSLQDPAGHLELLELMYMCLRLGYEGKYRQMERGLQQLRNVTDQLYHAITRYKEEFSRGLLITLDAPNYHQTRKKNYLHLLPPAWLISTIMVVFLLIIFTYFYTKLLNAATPLTDYLHSVQLSINDKEKPLREVS